MNVKKTDELQLNVEVEQAIYSAALFENRTVPDSRINAATWLTTKEAAAYMRSSPGEIRNKVYRGQLQPYKPFGRLLFKRIDLDRLIETSLNRR